MSDPYFDQLDKQLERIRAEKPTTFAGLRDILLDPVYDEIARQRDLNGPRDFDDRSAALPAGDTPDSATELFAQIDWSPQPMPGYTDQWPYSFIATSPAGEHITYTEGGVSMTPPLTDSQIAYALDNGPSCGPIAKRALRDLRNLRAALRSGVDVDKLPGM